MSKVKANTSSINIGLSEKDRRNIADNAPCSQVNNYGHLQPAIPANK